MSVLLGVSIVLWIITWLIQGFNLSSVAAFVSTLLFCGRKVKYFCKLSTLVTMESIALFVTVATQLLFHRFYLVKFVIILLLRVIFLSIVYYDTKTFVYVTIEKRKEEEE